MLLILAGVTIAALSGDNGILARARQAREETEILQEVENVTLEGYEDAIDYVLGVEITGVNTEETKPEEAIPRGAKVIQGDAREGIVISDENGNEWTWVEVPKTLDVYPTAGTKLDVDNITDEQCTTIYEDLANYATAYRHPDFSDTFYSADQAGFSGPEEYNEEKNNMLRSVYKYGGFWIGRYEVGDADATASNTIRTKDTGTSNTAVIKAKQIPYSYLTCSQAQELATGLSTGGKTSSLMFGIQWDLTCKFLETKGGLTQAEIKGEDGVGSVNWGNYSNSTILLSQGKYNTNPRSSTSQWLDITPGAKSGQMLLTTGASEDSNEMNIYDFAGNEWEWTLETNTKNTSIPCASRGGGYSNDGSNYPVFYRISDNMTSSYNDSGFRPMLY